MDYEVIWWEDNSGVELTCPQCDQKINVGPAVMYDTYEHWQYQHTLCFRMLLDDCINDISHREEDLVKEHVRVLRDLV